ncbi:MAG: aminotransferase class V-fold PLP-dependent enzyme, partial [Colwellia sp.]|nr:aminotransferase class V-fold PLP-dependent enzyme [Colwellia sp.]
IESYQSFYQEYNANVHRASHTLSAKATAAFEQARCEAKNFIQAKSIKEIIWTKGATESINLIANTLGNQILASGDEIIVAVSEHHANIVPWQLLAKRTGAVVKVLALEADGRVDMSAFDALIGDKTKIVCCGHVSNVLGKINPIEQVIAKAKAVGAISVIDGAQAVAHFSVDVQALDCDFYLFSAHKMYGPTGVGLLYGKQALLEKMPPYQAGGEMIATVSFSQETTFNVLPFKFEAGTPNIAGVIAFAQAIKFISQYHQQELMKYEQELTHYCYQALAKIPQVKFVVQEIPDIPVLAFTLDGQHNHDIASALDSVGIAIRSGHHCAMPLMDYLSLSGCLRVSMAPYNTLAEVDYFIACLAKIIENHVSVVEHNHHLEQSVQENNKQHSEQIIERFNQLTGWHNRHREIMLLSKKLPRLDKHLRSEQSLIQGCESLAWLVASQDEQQRFYFQADSDAKIIRGLLVIVLAAFNGKTAQEIHAFDVEAYFETLGLLQQLSPSRGNGVLAIVDKIKVLAQ